MITAFVLIQTDASRIPESAQAISGRAVDDDADRVPLLLAARPRRRLLPRLRQLTDLQALRDRIRFSRSG